MYILCTCNNNICLLIRAVDDVVLDYVISILEDLGEEANGEDNIDIDQFTEMLEAYIPGFASIDGYY